MYLWQLCYVLFPALTLLHLYISPHTKVEESFNLQAIHDVLEYGVPISDAGTKFSALFDHMTFPGAVPRTFIGALLVSGFAKPLIWLTDAHNSIAQFEARAVLGLATASSLAWFARAVHRTYGPQAAFWYVALQASQFHIWYYASRTLPNTFACALTNIALSFTMVDLTSSLNPTKRMRLAIYLITVATVIFRSELALLLGAQCLWLIIGVGNIGVMLNIVRRICIPAVLPGAIIALLLTITIDSYFWQSSTLLWPEMAAFLSNVLPKTGSQGASAWGTEPFYWYFTSALPRLLMNSAALLLSFVVVPLTWADNRIFDHLVPSLLYAAVYSFLPHKETRFMFPIAPPLTLVAALICSRITINVHKSFGRKLFVYFAVVSTAVTACLSHGILLPLSARNYPGGEALECLHDHVLSKWHSGAYEYIQQRAKPEIHVHLTNLALQTGITRFLEHPTMSSSMAQPHAFQPAVSAYSYGSDKRDPIVLPGDASHPALTIRPSIPRASTTSLPPGTSSTQPLWNYDKTSDESRLLEPVFWQRFDFVIVEHPARAIGAWEVVCEVQAVGRPSFIRPGYIGEPRTTELFHALYPRYMAKPLAFIHRLAYTVSKQVTGGYWIELPMETRLFVLKRSKSGTNQGPASDQVQSETLALPASQATNHKALPLDELGPLVVNKDGTLSRLENWKQMTEQERKRTVAYLKKRNLLRLEEAEAAPI